MVDVHKQHPRGPRARIRLPDLACPTDHVRPSDLVGRIKAFGVHRIHYPKVINDLESARMGVHLLGFGMGLPGRRSQHHNHYHNCLMGLTRKLHSDLDVRRSSWP